MSRLDEFFRWNVGDEVTLRQGHYALFDKKRAPMIIVQRVLIECSGGIQPYYEIRMHAERGVSGYVQFNEIELMNMPKEGD